MPALYLGSVLNFLPLIGVRTPLVLCLALLFRCNLPVTIGLQFVTNPLTAGPFYYADYKLGVWILSQLGVSWDFVPLMELLEEFSLSDLSGYTVPFLRSYTATCLGGLALGGLLGVVLHGVYLLIARQTRKLQSARPSAFISSTQARPLHPKL